MTMAQMILMTIEIVDLKGLLENESFVDLNRFGEILRKNAVSFGKLFEKC